MCKQDKQLVWITKLNHVFDCVKLLGDIVP